MTGNRDEVMDFIESFSADGLQLKYNPTDAQGMTTTLWPAHDEGLIYR